jgi:hypothetical protein
VQVGLPPPGEVTVEEALDVLLPLYGSSVALETVTVLVITVPLGVPGFT